MKKLSDDELTLIAPKVAEHGIEHLFKFMRASTSHKRVGKSDIVFRDLPPDRVNLLFHLYLTPSKNRFIKRVIESGNGDYCVVSASKKLNDKRPVISDIKATLNNAISHNHRGAIFLLMFLDVLAADESLVDNAISTFKGFLERQELMIVRCEVLSVGYPYQFRTMWWRRPLPQGLVRRTLCTSKDTCKGVGHRYFTTWLPPGPDYEYNLSELCISCRFDVEIGFIEIFYHFLRMFGFIDDLYFYIRHIICTFK